MNLTKEIIQLNNMKTIKIGQINFYKNDLWGDTGYNKVTRMIDTLNTFSENKYVYGDCLNENCDIVLYSLYAKIENLDTVKGQPILIYYTDELMCCGENWIFDNPFEFYKRNNLSISFYDDSDDNLFFPLFVESLKDMMHAKEWYPQNFNKTKFCTFCASNGNFYETQFRTNVVKYISENYKQITCCGKVLNNTNGKYLPYDFVEAINYHDDYKFNLCFENAASSGNLSYITEKIVNAFRYMTIPIYWGAERITEWFNQKAFINCNGMNEQEILEKIKEVDNDKDLYDYMIHQNPLKFDFDYYEYFVKKLDKFINDHI